MSSPVVNYTPVFKAHHKRYESKNYRVICHEGGSRSSKTYSICQHLIMLASQGKKISVVSASLPHLKRGARRDFLKIMQDDLGIYNDRSFNKTDNVYYFPGGGYIEFFGVDNSGKVFGPGREILYINEANLISFFIFSQLNIRTTDFVVMDYNPIDEDHWVYGQADHADNTKILSNFTNNQQTCLRRK